MPINFNLPPATRPLRLSDIKYAIYGRAGYGRGIRFMRVCYAGWDFEPNPLLVAKDIDQLGLNLRNFTEPLARVIKTIMTRSILKNFQLEGRPVPWQPLAEYTERVRGSARPILYRTGALERVASSFGIWAITPTNAYIKKLPQAVWYGTIHQSGYGSIEMMAREQLGPGATELMVKARIARITRQAGRNRPHGRQETVFVIPQREWALFQVEDIEAIQEIFVEWMESKADEVGRMWRW